MPALSFTGAGTCRTYIPVRTIAVNAALKSPQWCIAVFDISSLRTPRPARCCNPYIPTLTGLRGYAKRVCTQGAFNDDFQIDLKEKTGTDGDMHLCVWLSAANFRRGDDAEAFRLLLALSIGLGHFQSIA